MCVCVCVYICVYIYIHIYINGFKKPQYVSVVREKSSQYSYSPCLNLAHHRQVSVCGSNLALYLPEL